MLHAKLFNGIIIQKQLKKVSLHYILFKLFLNKKEKCHIGTYFFDICIRQTSWSAEKKEKAEKFIKTVASFIKFSLNSTIFLYVSSIHLGIVAYV